MNQMVLLFIFVGGTLLATGCQSNSDNERIIEWAEASRKIDCQMDGLEKTSSKMWDKTNRELEKALPMDILEYEKSNMLKVRNAELLRMFETYQEMEGPIKAKVDLTEKMDFAMADSMRVLQQKQRDYSDSIRTALMEIEADNTKTKLQEKIKMINNIACSKILQDD